MNDLALGIVVFTFLAVPASLLLLVLADVIRLEGEGVRRRWIRRCLGALALPAVVPFGLAAWGWAGAAHLEPLCQAYASPEFRSTRPISTDVISLDTKPGTESPQWVSAFGNSAFGNDAPRLLLDPADPASTTTRYVLEVRRLTHHRNLWFTVQMERFRLLERPWGTVLAEGDELWVEAGRERYHCGIVSGAQPVSSDRTPWPGGAGVARFVVRGLQPGPLRP